MSKKKTHEEFIKQIQMLNNNIDVLEKYQNSQTKIKFKCKIDGYEWSAKPDSVLHGSGCPLCGRKKKSEKLKKSNEKFLQELYTINPNILVLDKYVNDKTKLRCKCKIDGYEWLSKPNYLLSGHGCHKCSNAERYNTDSFIEKMQNINSNIEILGEYVNARTKIKCRCLLCGYKWSTAPNNLISDKGCPNCNTSKGEKRIKNFLEDNKVKYISQYKFKDCKNVNQLPFDFYLSDYHMCIEYDGRQHFESINHFGGEEKFNLTQLRDNIKTQYCQDNKIKLLRIPYWEFNNIENILENELLKGGGEYA